MAFVVSANYREFNKGNWLVRGKEQPIEECQEMALVVAKDFSLERPLDGEESFGCKTVAICRAVVDDMMMSEFNALRAMLIKIKLNGFDGFYEEVSQLPVRAGKYLVLDQSGMYYMPVYEQAA